MRTSHGGGELYNLLNPKNKNLTRAKKEKNDEFYTQLTDIEKELSHYDPEIFRDKVIYCPTDVATDQGKILQSQFVHYFQLKKDDLKFKKLIATCLAEKGEEFNNKYILVRKLSPYADPSSQYYNPSLTEDDDRYWSWGESTSECKADSNYGSGDFRSEECLQLFDEADIVITNPPFSLFRDFFDLLLEKEKKFLILGSINEINFENVYYAFKDRKCWRGVTIHNGHTKFLVPDGYSTPGERSKITEDGRKYTEVGVRWYTNLDNATRHEKYIPYKSWEHDSDTYKTFDDTDILYIEKSKDVPLDYDGVMGVPVTFLDRLNPTQFEIVGFTTPSKYYGDIPCKAKVNEKNVYARILIKNRPAYNLVMTLDRLKYQSGIKQDDINLYKIMKKEYYEKALYDGDIAFQNPKFAHYCEIDSERDEYEKCFTTTYDAEFGEVGLPGKVGMVVPSISYCFSLTNRFREVSDDEVILQFKLSDILRFADELELGYIHGRVCYCCDKNTTSVLALDVVSSGELRANNKILCKSPSILPCLLKQFTKGKSFIHENEYRLVIMLMGYEDDKNQLDNRFIHLYGDKYTTAVKNLFRRG